MRYVVSGSAVKRPRKMYWTEREFASLGKPVAVPSARVGGVTIVYNNNFPRTVVKEVTVPGRSSPTDGTTNALLPELRTLWYEQQQGNIKAHNQEGRVFLELLGDARPDGSRQHLGFEIVDVFRQPLPVDVVIELGERITPPPPGALEDLFPEPVQPAGLGPVFSYQHNVAGSDRKELYASRETINLNDYLVHWLEEGLQGLQWPSILGRYRLVWPADEAKYSHYVRPPAATEDQAWETAVQLATETVPTIAYQDPLDLPRAKLTEDYKFYTWLEATQPAHRTLLGFTAGEHIGFERVFSWLDSNLKATNFTGTLATNLARISQYYADQASYPVAYANYLGEQANYLAAFANYTNNLAARSRGVNGDWKLFVSSDSPGAIYSWTIDSWTLVVETSDSATGTLSTNEFTSGGLTIPPFGNATPYPSTVTVSGIINAVTSLRVKLNRVTSVSADGAWPSDLEVFLMGPRSNVCALMSDAGGSTPLKTANLVFDDAAATAMPQSGGITSGTYRPTNYDLSESLPPGGSGAIGTSLAALLAPGPSRGANGEWNLFVRDAAIADSGAISSWAVVVVSTNSATGTLSTNEFISNSAITINDNAEATPYPSTITVSGITDTVTAVRVKFNGFSHTFPEDVHAVLAGPRGDVYALMSDAGRGDDAVKVDLLFDDAASTPIPDETAITSGTYRPADYFTPEPLPPGGIGFVNSLIALLDATPIEVAEPIALVAPAIPTPWPDELVAPRVDYQTVEVGRRLRAPGGELGATGSYVTGHINQKVGTLFNPNAYKDPFVSGYEAANQGAIIPVNAIPNQNQLEVWWVRTNTARAGFDAANGARGFKTILWPSVIGRYTIQWPANPREIVLASKLGSETLDPLEALGTIYYENDPTQTGYNPNEEHAAMVGGTAYATRDDLNITSGASYSSEPFVFVAYQASDGR
ncbi:MAG: hypothetical protein HY674_12070, partial [Chloroflexi bacterium]|nr:hypothetical protein [Chloroflexota bacterium]